MINIEQSLYEYPLNERMRVFLRLESLFNECSYFVSGNNSWDNQACLNSILEIINTIDRIDIRTELIKELDKHINNLEKLSDTPNINTSKLNKTLDQLQSQLLTVQKITSKISKKIKNDYLLNTVKQRKTVNTNSRPFDIPGLQHWLYQPIKVKYNQLEQWIEEFSDIKNSINLILKIIRNSTFFNNYTANAGFFQKAIDSTQNFQLIRVKIKNCSEYFPEISGGKHRVTVRFLGYNPDFDRPKQITEDVKFELSCCNY